MMKKFLAVFLCLCMLAVPASAMRVQVSIGSTQVHTADVDTKTAQTLTLEAAPYTAQGRTMVPVRVITESLGATVGWDDATQKVTITQGENVVELIIGSTEAKINGEVKVLDVAPETINGRTFIPMRFVGEAFGYTLQWVPSIQNVIISDVPVILKSEYSVATALDVLFWGWLFDENEETFEIEKWMDVYAIAMVISDFRNYKLGQPQPIDILARDEGTDALCVVPAAINNAVELAANVRWARELQTNDPQTFAAFKAYLDTKPTSRLCTNEEFMDSVLEYILMVSDGIETD